MKKQSISLIQKIAELSNEPEFAELQDYEVISFMMNLNTKIF